jgi:hypothetical protein
MSRTELSLAVLVVSCDKYSDLWRPFIGQLGRYWPLCPYPKYLQMNENPAEFEGFTSLRVGPDVSWSDNLAKALSLIPERYVLLFIEDLMLRAPVDESRLAEVLAWASGSEPDYLRLNPTERPQERVNRLVGRVREGAMYRTSTVLALWKKSSLASLLESGESAWQFEIDGSYRSDRLKGFYSTWADCFPVVNAVIKGKWRRSAARELSAQGAPLDLDSRRLMTRREETAFAIKSLRSAAFKLAPMGARRGLYDRLVLGR